MALRPRPKQVRVQHNATHLLIHTAVVGLEDRSWPALNTLPIADRAMATEPRANGALKRTDTGL
jgi:hypothetical protein